MPRVSCRRPRAPRLRRHLLGGALIVATTATMAVADPADLGAPGAPPPPQSPTPAVDTVLRGHAEVVTRKLWLTTIANTTAHIDPARLAMWDRLAHCETAGNWRDGGQYGGGLGIYVGTWKMYGGREFAPRPQDATKAQQIEVAERIALDGMGGWGCAERLGLN